MGAGGPSETKRFLGLFVLGFLVFGLPNAYQYLTFQLPWHDAGHVYRIVMNIFTHGSFYSLDWNDSHFTIHFSPFFYLLAGIIWPIGTMSWMVVVETAALAAIAATVSLISSRITEKPGLSLLVGLSFVVNPYAMAANLYPHYEVFGMLFLALSVWAIFSQRTIASLAFLLLALTVKQDVWIYGVLAFLTIVNRPRAKGVAAAIFLCLSYKLLVLNWIYPMLYPHAVNRMADIWAYGQTEGDVLKYFWSHPVETWSRVFSEHGLAFLLSMGLIPLFAGLRAFPALALTYLWVNATAIERQSLAFYYSLPALLLMFIAIPIALNNAEKLFGKIGKKGRYLGFVMPVIAGLILHISLPQGLHLSPSLASVFAKPYTDSDRKLHQILRHAIPEGKTVYTQFAIASYIPYRSEIFVSHVHAKALNQNEIEPDIILLDIKRDDFSDLPPSQVNHAVYFRPSYVLKDHFEGIYLYERGGLAYSSSKN